jgi:hypothetical protein
MCVPLEIGSHLQRRSLGSGTAVAARCSQESGIAVAERGSIAQETGPARRLPRGGALLCLSHGKRRDGPVSEASERRSNALPSCAAASGHHIGSRRLLSDVEDPSTASMCM